MPVGNRSRINPDGTAPMPILNPDSPYGGLGEGRIGRRIVNIPVGLDPAPVEVPDVIQNPNTLVNGLPLSTSIVAMNAGFDWLKTKEPEKNNLFTYLLIAIVGLFLFFILKKK